MYGILLNYYNQIYNINNQYSYLNKKPLYLNINKKKIIKENKKIINKEIKINNIIKEEVKDIEVINKDNNKDISEHDDDSTVYDYLNVYSDYEEIDDYETR